MKYGLPSELMEVRSAPKVLHPPRLLRLDFGNTSPEWKWLGTLPARVDNALEVLRESRVETRVEAAPGLSQILGYGAYCLCQAQKKSLKFRMCSHSAQKILLGFCYIVLSRLGVPHAHKGGARTNECSIVDCV